MFAFLYENKKAERSFTLFQLYINEKTNSTL